MSVFTDHAAFTTACGQPAGTFNPDQFVLYANILIPEEVIEFSIACDQMYKAGSIAEHPLSNPLYRVRLAEAAKEAIDIIMVAAGFLNNIGIDADAAWAEVLRSNMSKLDPETGLAVRREDGKIMKGPNYSPADLLPLIPHAPTPDIVIASA
jgi:predicted HAD superfamily Cof-like phosphohydrolase